MYMSYVYQFVFLFMCIPTLSTCSNTYIYICIYTHIQLQWVCISYVDVCGFDTLTYVIVRDLRCITDEDLSLKLLGDPRIKGPPLIQANQFMIQCSLFLHPKHMFVLIKQ